MKASRISIIAVSLMMAGCMTPPEIKPQHKLLEQALSRSPSGDSELGPAANWWEAFHDTQLDQLMQDALTDNPTLSQALVRVRAAQSIADIARAALAPSISLGAAETWQRFSSHDVIPPPYAGGNYWRGNTGLNLNWDLDFWGRQASLLKQAKLTTDAYRLDVGSARLALSGAVLQAYVELDRDHALVDIARSETEQRRQILDITYHRRNAGLDTNVEVREASGAVPLAQVDLRQAETAVALDVHQLAALSGHGAEGYAQIERPNLDPDTVLPLPAALPANLLGRRPDVLAARDRIEAAMAGKAAARAAFYPNINLSAFAGTAAVGFGKLFETSSGVYGAGPAISLPIFDAGRLSAEYQGAAAEIDDAVDVYNQTVLQAVRQTADQISLIKALSEEITQQERSLDDAEVAFRLAKKRYDAGLTTYLTVLNTETQVLTERRQRVISISSLAIARVTLLLAVGGSFDPSVPLDL